MIIAATGHRPPKLGGYSDNVFNKLVRFAEQHLDGALPNDNGLLCVSGMAQGWDQAFAQAAINVGIPFVAAVPCDGFSYTWPLAAKERYDRMLAKAQKVHIVSPGSFEIIKLFKRNEWMVDNSDTLLALWDGVPQGGTFRCVHYARHKNKAVINLWDQWEKFK